MTTQTPTVIPTRQLAVLAGEWLTSPINWTAPADDVALALALVRNGRRNTVDLAAALDRAAARWPHSLARLMDAARLVLTAAERMAHAEDAGRSATAERVDRTVSTFAELCDRPGAHPREDRDRLVSVLNAFGTRPDAEVAAVVRGLLAELRTREDRALRAAAHAHS